MEAGDWASTGEQSPAVFTLLCCKTRRGWYVLSRV